MLQERVNELGSAILDIKNDKVYIIGFAREEMLQSYLNKGARNWSSMGLYDLYDEEDLVFHDIKDNALIIVQRNGKEVRRHQYRHEAKKTVQLKNDTGQTVSRTFRIRKSMHSDHYHFYFVTTREEENVPSMRGKQSLIFDDKDELNRFLTEEFGIEL